MIPLLWAWEAAAAVRRFAVVVGNNEGFSSNRTLYFAEQDARKIDGLLGSLGGVAPDDRRLLLGRGRNELLNQLAAIREPIAAARAGGDQTVLYFFYSGHADEKQLQLGRSWLTWGELEELLSRSGADVRVAFVDACQSGTLTRSKGGTLAPGFVLDVADRLDSTGTVIITSSNDDEASQESNEIGGSYFTHFLASALSGTADEDEDGRVSLAEAYRYVYHETVFRTSTTRGGAQHPMYQWDLSGSGDIVLTELERAGSTLVFPASSPGTYAVFDVDRRMFVAEVEVAGTERRLSVRPGRYQVQKRLPTWLAVADLSLPAHGSTTLGPERFRRGEYEDDVAKGAIDQSIRRAKMPLWSVHMAVGGRSFFDETVAAQYFPATPAAGIHMRWNWRDFRYLSLDLLGGVGAGELVFTDLDYGVPVVVGSGTAGLGFGYCTPQVAFQFGGGLHLQAVWLGRSFPGQDIEDQSLFTIAPGGQVWVGWHPGRFELELELRTHWLPYVVDGRDQGMGDNELLLNVGYRF